MNNKKIKPKTLSVEDIIYIVSSCGSSDMDEYCDGCPLGAECLMYYTGDDSEL